MFAKRFIEAYGMKGWLCVVAALVLIALSFQGCGGGELGATVAGRVTLDGNPLPSGMVVFHPVTEAAVAMGAISSNGSYRLRTGSLEGLTPGDYQVTVVATKETAAGASGNLVEDAPLPERITPVEYASVETSKLRFTVKPGGNTIDLPLVTPPK